MSLYKIGKGAGRHLWLVMAVLFIGIAILTARSGQWHLTVWVSVLAVAFVIARFAPVRPYE